ncbi:MAG: hypothetical protein M3O30_16170 [Planctomycetota bacterium]|nr:hypothetical protein [Planctomycetota bacterium]
MALTQSGLTGGGNTANFQVQYEKSLSNQSVVIQNANALLGVIENEFNVTTNWFNTPSSKFGSGNRQVVNLNLDASAQFPGANNNGYGNPMNLDAQNIAGDANTAGRVEDVFMAEWVEILMSIAGNWNAGDSSGEAFSQFASILRFQTGHYNYYSSFVDQWLNGTGQAWLVTGKKYVTSPNSARSDWVTKTFTGTDFDSDHVNGDGDQISFGCGLAFLYYLSTQLGFSVNQIIANYKSNLASIYKAVTGDAGDPFPFFLNLISSVYPASSNATIPGPVTDNPFPIAIVSFAVGKNTFGLDEAEDIINNQAGLVTGAFWVWVDGFNKQSFNSLNISANNNFSGDFFKLSGVQISPNPKGPQFQAGVNDTTPQRIAIPFDITLSDPFVMQNPGSYTLTVSLTSNGNAVSGGVNSTQFELLAKADPYFSNLDITQDNQAYLSQDLRVFTATPGQNSVPVPGGPTLSDSVPGAYQYIQDLLKYLNATASFTNPKGTDPFTSVFPDQYGVNQTDSSVTPLTIDLSAFPNIKFLNNYNFAVARVRLQGSSGTSGKATDVRVFFRLFCTQSNDTDFDINSTYKSNPDASGNPGSPLAGSDDTTIPMFATDNFQNNTDYNPSGPNIADIEIPDHQDGVYRYYGCFLNVYDQNNVIDGKPVQALLNGTHHCLVAQIAYDDAPIPQGVSPLSWDQLAQRNLQVTLSDNPGPASSHRIPQTFDCRPSGAVVPPGTNQPQISPDELMIDWGSIPPGSIATLYWPQVDATDVIDLASQFYSFNPLTVFDSHTIKLAVTQGFSYVPIPSGAGQNFAGLFTVDLPPGKVSTGQTFKIVVRRLSSKTYTPPPPIQTPPVTHTLPVRFAGRVQKGKARRTLPGKKPISPEFANPQLTMASNGSWTWRYAVGSFVVQIPVTTADNILPSEMNTLAVMKWRLQEMMPSNRWYPVLQRYMSYISDRITGLGGDPNSIPPSLSGAPINVIEKEESRACTGKVCEVIYDCFGDFEGFVIESCSDRHVFKSCEKGIGDLVLRACRERVVVTIYVEALPRNKIKRIIIRCC